MDNLFQLPITKIREQANGTPLHPSVHHSLDEIAAWLSKKETLAESPGKLTGKENIALFYGPVESDKISAAAMLAHQAGRELYNISLSQLISKYIGETEQHLTQLFEKAEEKNWILFFDEADALFGKRTEIKDSHDRYANLALNYLQERIENFKGLAILSTNRRTNIDAAFTRRLRYIIKFPEPEKHSQ